MARIDVKISSSFICLCLLYCTNAIAQEKGDRENGDYNFDGETDYRVFVMANGRSQIWEYHLKVLGEQSYKTTTLDLANPQFSDKNKRIFTYHPGGHSGLIFVANLYFWQNYEIHLESSVVQRYDRSSDSYVLVELNALGSTPVVREVRVNTEEQARRYAALYSSTTR